MATETKWVRRFDEKWVQKISTDQPQQDWLDELVRGLCLRVSGKTDRKTWLVRYRADGKHRRMKLGTYPALTLKQARERARDVIQSIVGGSDPLQEQRRATVRAKENTFRTMAEEVLRARARKGRHGRATKERTQRDRKRYLERHVYPFWGDRDVTTITKREVLLLVEGIAERGAPVEANRVLALIHLIFNDGVGRGFANLEANPAHLVPKPGVEASRERWLNRDELRTVWRATEEEGVLVRGAFRLAILTAARIGSVERLRWEDITHNGAGPLWTIPADHFKGGRTHLVPLSHEALDVVAELRSVALSDVWVFPSRAKSKEPFITNLNGSLVRIRDRSKLAKSWVAHDFRRTFRSHATTAVAEGGLGVAPHVADAVLGHAENSLGWTTYQGDRERYLLAEKREALEAWGAFVRKAVEAMR